MSDKRTGKKPKKIRPQMQEEPVITSNTPQNTPKKNEYAAQEIEFQVEMWAERFVFCPYLHHQI